MKSFLILEDGKVFYGKSFGSDREVIADIVFNTAMTGYVELLSTPANAGMAVVMTYPIIGSAGVSLEDSGIGSKYIGAIIAHEFSKRGNNFRSEMDLGAFLKVHDIPAIYGIDTRALSKHIRNNGSMKCMITRDENFDLDLCVSKIKKFHKIPNLNDICVQEKTVYEGSGKDVAVIDFGGRAPIVKLLKSAGCKITVYPAFFKASDVLAGGHDGIIITDGPGTPTNYMDRVYEVRELCDSDTPIFGIAFGHEILALAHDFSIKKMKFGHNGASHPVRDMATGRIYPTTQDHLFVVDDIDPAVADITFTHLNDSSAEGFKIKGKNISATAFHPGTSAGPKDTLFIFNDFIDSL